MLAVGCWCKLTRLDGTNDLVSSGGSGFRGLVESGLLGVGGSLLFELRASVLTS